MTGERLLIVNADDFGLSPAVSAGILQAHRAGIVTSTTFMANWPEAPAAAALLSGVPALGVGCHLNLTGGPPVLPPERVPSLVGPGGCFRRGIRHLAFGADPAEVEAEWNAQVERFIALVGRPPTHLDSHHFVHSVPRLTRPLLAVARRHGIPAVRVLRPREAMPAYQWLGPVAGFLARRWVAASARLVAADDAVATPDRVLAGDFDRARLLRWLDTLPPGVTELICHPGGVDEVLARRSGRLRERERELQDLCSPEVLARVRERGIRLGHFGHLERGEAI